MRPAKAGLLIAVVLPLVAAQDALPTGETIMDRYIAVIGGREAHERVKTEVRTTSMELKGRDVKFAVTVYRARPDKMYTITEIPGAGKVEEGVDGDVAWSLTAARGPALKEGVEREDLRRASRASEQDREALPRLLNRVPARKGDVYLIPAGVAHAIGAGCLILEVQEPTDFTVQPEAWCGDYHLSPYEMTLGLDEEAALDCFDYSHLVGKRALAAGRKRPRVRTATAILRVEALIDSSDTPDFAVNRIRLTRGEAALERAPAVHVVTGGAGLIRLDGLSRQLARGDYFFLPAAARGARLVTERRLEVVECLPPAAAG